MKRKVKTVGSGFIGLNGNSTRHIEKQKIQTFILYVVESPTCNGGMRVPLIKSKKQNQRKMSYYEYRKKGKFLNQGDVNNGFRVEGVVFRVKTVKANKYKGLNHEDTEKREREEKSKQLDTDFTDLDGQRPD